MDDIVHSLDYDGEEAQRVLYAANDYRQSLTHPKQSQFRVIAILVYQEETDNSLHHIIGANCEPCHIQGSICAERSALIQLRHRPNSTTLLRIYIVSDAEGKPLPPGMLCREYLSSMAEDGLPIILADASTSIIEKHTLGDLYPYPSLYRHLSRNDLVRKAQSFVSSSDGGLQHPSTISPEAGKLYRFAMDVNNKDNRDNHHPIRYSAAILFNDKTHAVSWMKKGLEYGTTLDPVSQLAHVIESQADSIKPVLLVQVDQFGICHAPFGGARAFLNEYGHGSIQVIVHNEKDGKCVAVTTEQLAPSELEIDFVR